MLRAEGQPSALPPPTDGLVLTEALTENVRLHADRQGLEHTLTRAEMYGEWAARALEQAERSHRRREAMLTTRLADIARHSQTLQDTNQALQERNQMLEAANGALRISNRVLGSALALHVEQAWPDAEPETEASNTSSGDCLVHQPS